jgi:hypothetical protein
MSTDIAVVKYINDKEKIKVKDLIEHRKTASKDLHMPWAFCVVDDCTNDTRICKDPALDALLRRGRHFSIPTIIWNSNTE